MLESNAMRRLSLNGTYLSFSEEELKKLMKTNEKKNKERDFGALRRFSQ